MRTLIWLQASCCGGETTSLLNADQPDILTSFRMLDMEIVWHPSLSLVQGEEVSAKLGHYVSGDRPLDVLVLEGAVYADPPGEGTEVSADGHRLKNWLTELSSAARYTIAAGTCASFGGIMSTGGNEFGATGLQWLWDVPGGLLGPEYRSLAGLPVINVPGCPAHPDWMVGTLGAAVSGRLTPRHLDDMNRPKMFYSKLAHHGCPRNEYYEFKASAETYGQQGCLFENLGCKGTLCESDCNERLWLYRTGSCPRGGFPCLSCTSPLFPDAFVPFFETNKISDIPTTLPLDVPKAWYAGISGLAKHACPERLRTNAVSSTHVDTEQHR